MIHATSWMDLKIVLMGEKSQFQKLQTTLSWQKKRDHSCLETGAEGGWTEKSESNFRGWWEYSVSWWWWRFQWVYTAIKIHTVHFEWMQSIVCKSDLNKTDIKKNSPTGLRTQWGKKCATLGSIAGTWCWWRPWHENTKLPWESEDRSPYSAWWFCVTVLKPQSLNKSNGRPGHQGI